MLLSTSQRMHILGGLLLAGLSGACDTTDGLSTAEIEAEAKEYVRAELGLKEDAALFTDVHVPGYEQGELIACGSVSGSRANGASIQPRRFIVQLDPARWVRWETGDTPGALATPDFSAAWSDLCRHPDEENRVPLVPD